MARTCIICGGAAGSAEHVFPAALGGRRKHKGIYCHPHNNAYSGLVSLLSEQLTPINALIGVRPDRRPSPKSVRATDTATGVRYELSIRGNRLREPRIVSEEVAEGARIVQMQFPDRVAMREWLDEQKAAGVEVNADKPRESVQLLGSTTLPMSLGGEEGLRAIGYLGQTFLAQAFPLIARSSALDTFKSYTLGSLATQSVWWHFPAQSEQENAFEFGHRFVVGVDAEDGTIFGRASLFSTWHFAMIFGSCAEHHASQSAIFDINPLAEHPPGDVKTVVEPTARHRVARPEHPTAALGDAIDSGTMKTALDTLLRKISDANLRRTARSAHTLVQGAEVLSLAHKEELFRNLLVGESQRILNLMRYVVADFKRATPQLSSLFQRLDRLVASDATTPNGITAEATGALQLATEALLNQLLADYHSGLLDEQRLAQLLGEGLGASIVGRAILMPVIDTL